MWAVSQPEHTKNLSCNQSSQRIWAVNQSITKTPLSQDKRTGKTKERCHFSSLDWPASNSQRCTIFYYLFTTLIKPSVHNTLCLPLEIHFFQVTKNQGDFYSTLPCNSWLALDFRRRSTGQGRRRCMFLCCESGGEIKRSLCDTVSQLYEISRGI